MNIAAPKVFISYSWSCSDRVIELAQRLVNDGVDVVLDKWELREGQDKYAFMERSVTDESITKVLMICDKAYADKANSREGGVGDETMVISPEVYAKATEIKYIPIIFERDENGKEYTPAYLKPRIYIDLSNEEYFEKNYESLLRNLYNKPEHSKPTLGMMPEWLKEESVSLTNLRAVIKKIEADEGKNPAKLRFIIRKFNEDFIAVLNEFAPKEEEAFSEKLLQQIDAAKPLRDLFLDYVEALIKSDLDIESIIGDFFEYIYNGTYSKKGNSYSEGEFEFAFFMIWEMFICSTAILLYHECFSNLNSLLNRTFFLNESPLVKNPQPHTFIHFRPGFSYIEEHIKPNCETPRLYTLAGDIAIKREKRPIITRDSMANADVILYQLSEVLGIDDINGWSWFPKLYCYLGGRYGSSQQQIWSKLVSRAHCEKLFPLFGVTQLSQLIDKTKKNQTNRDMHYNNSFDIAPTIQRSIKFDKIGTIP